jgi:MFS family permease
MATSPDDLVAASAASGAPAVPRAGSGAPELTSTQRKRAMVVCVAAAFLTLLDVNIVTVALPSMEPALHMSSADATWAIAGYTLSFGLTLIPAGRLADEIGRRKLFIWGLVLFAVTGVLCGMATSAVWMDGARLARGVAAGLVAPQVIGYIQQMYPPLKRGRAFGYYGATVALSTAIGPLLGGLILQAFGTGDGWRWVFYLFVPLDVLACVYAVRVLPGDPRIRQRRSLDLVGALLLGLSVTAFMLPMIMGGSSGTSSGASGGARGTAGGSGGLPSGARPGGFPGGAGQPPGGAGSGAGQGGFGGHLPTGTGAAGQAATHASTTAAGSGRPLWLLPIGAVLLVLFVLYERSLARRQRQPLLDLSLFRVRSYWVGTLVAAAFYGGFTGIFLVLSQYFQQGLHYTALHASESIATFTVGSAICGILGGRLVNRIGRSLVIYGSVATAVGLAATAVLVRSASPSDIGLALALPLLVAGCGAGFVISANQTIALHRVPRKEGSTSAGVYQTGMKLGVTLGTSVASGLYFATLTSTHDDFAKAASAGLTGAAALAGVAFLVALPGLTFRRRRNAEPIVAMGGDRVGVLSRAGRDGAPLEAE